MLHYQLIIRLQHTDRRGNPLNYPTDLQILEWKNDKFSISASIERIRTNNDISVKETSDLGWSLGDLLFYRDKAGMICWREQDEKGEVQFIQHNVLETPFQHTYTRRLRSETDEHILWCYQAQHIDLHLAANIQDK